jgi:hypothetical protein
MENFSQGAEWTTRFKNNLPDSAFLYIQPGGKKDEEGKTKPRSLRHFPYKNENGEIDRAHILNAIARIPQALFLSDAQKKSLQARARSIYLKFIRKNSKKANSFINLFNKIADEMSADVAPQDPCIIKIQQATTPKEAVAAYFSCITPTVKARYGEGPNPLFDDAIETVIKPLDALIKKFLGFFKDVWNRYGLQPANTYKDLLKLLCDPNFRRVFFNPLLDLFKNFGEIPLFKSGFITALANFISPGLPISTVVSFLNYWLNFAKQNPEFFNSTLDGLCQDMSNREMTEAEAKEMFDTFFDKMRQIGVLLSLNINLGVMGGGADAVAKVVKDVIKWISDNPGQTITVAVLVAIVVAAGILSGGLAAPAAASLVLAIATALGIGGDFTQSDIEQMINSSMGA